MMDDPVMLYMTGVYAVWALGHDGPNPNSRSASRHSSHEHFDDTHLCSNGSRTPQPMQTLSSPHGNASLIGRTTSLRSHTGLHSIVP